MKKVLTALASLFLLTACTPQLGGNLPYRVWESWEEMKEVLGDHYLFPTYLPEVTERSEHATKRSYFNNVPRDSNSDELFYGYDVSFRGDRQNDSIFISATDYGRRNRPPRRGYSDYEIYEEPSHERERFVPFENLLHGNERFNEHTVTIGGIDIAFLSIHGTFVPFGENPDEWNICHTRYARIVHYAFNIDTVTYVMLWVQDNVEDRYADDEQREGMLRVAKSIIEQVVGVE